MDHLINVQQLYMKNKIYFKLKTMLNRLTNREMNAVSCERYECEITLITACDLKGIILLPDNSKQSISCKEMNTIYIPSPKKLKPQNDTPKQNWSKKHRQKNDAQMKNKRLFSSTDEPERARLNSNSESPINFGLDLEICELNKSNGGNYRSYSCDSGYENSDSDEQHQCSSTPAATIAQWIDLQSPYVGKTDLHTNLESVSSTKHSKGILCRNLDQCDLDDYSCSTTTSLPLNTDDSHLSQDFNDVYLDQELTNALEKEVREKFSLSTVKDTKRAPQHQKVILPLEIKESKSQLLSKIEIRKQELHQAVDSWHLWITNQIELSYDNKWNLALRDKIQNGDKEDISTRMCAFLNTKQNLNKHMFGTFTMSTILQNECKAANWDCKIHIMSDVKHVRTFESRDSTIVTDYMCTAINTDQNNNYIVTDLGANTCGVFSQSGRLIRDLDIAPLDEPTCALSNQNNQILLITKNGLKFFQPNSEFSCEMTTTDIKSPQCLTINKEGNYIISDMHDCGSVIVTLDKESLVPVRMFCGNQYLDTPEAFTSAWYIYNTQENYILLSDRVDHMIKCYTQHGEYKWSAGGLGAETGLFFTPAGITQDHIGNILVADCNNHRVQLFSPSGEWLGIVVSNENQEIKHPMDVAINSTGDLLVLQASGTVSIFNYLSK